MQDVVVAFDISRTTFHRILLNFFWAYGYNIVRPCAVPSWAGCEQHASGSCSGVMWEWAVILIQRYCNSTINQSFGALVHHSVVRCSWHIASMYKPPVPGLAPCWLLQPVA
jgi:hypothetical protein